MSVYRFVDGMGDTGMVVGGAGVSYSFRRDALDRGRPDERLEVVGDPDELLKSEDIQHAVIDGLTHAADRRLATDFELAQAEAEQRETFGPHVGEAAMRDGTGTIGFGS